MVLKMILVQGGWLFVQDLPKKLLLKLKPKGVFLGILDESRLEKTKEIWTFGGQKSRLLGAQPKRQQRHRFKGAAQRSEAQFISMEACATSVIRVTLKDRVLRLQIVLSVARGPVCLGLFSQGACRCA